MPRLPLCLALLVLAPIHAAAQKAAETPQVPVEILSVGGFLGQLDGFCEQPGGTYDLAFIELPLVQSCAGPNGQIQKGTWPVALGGLLGAQTWLKSERAQSKTRAPLVLVPGNNQIANFTFLNEQVLASAVTYKATPIQVSGTQSREEQILARLQRFWQEMNLLGADAIGLATEDFVRSLRDPREQPNTSVRDRGSILHRWLRLATNQGTGIPIIGSNAVIKTRGIVLPYTGKAAAVSNPQTTLNIVELDEFSLKDIDKNESAGWLTEIHVIHPTRANINLGLWELGPIAGSDAPAPLSSATTKGDAESTKLDPGSGALRPGFRYEVRIREGSTDFSLKFQTHSALTPRQNSEIKDGKTEGFPALDGFPVVARTLTDGSPLLILSLVDPGVKSFLGTEPWKWKPGKDKCTPSQQCDWNEVTCPAKECEIDFMSPTEAVTAVIRRTFLKPTDRKPFIVLISALSDTQTQEIIEEFPEIRIVVLDPESLMLGRASRAYPPSSPDAELEQRLALRNTGNQAFSGDLGLFGVFSGQHPETTSLVIRPEWVGETAAKLSAKVGYSPNYEWRITDAVINVGQIPGAALRWKGAGPCDVAKPNGPQCTAFWMDWPDRPEGVSYGTLQSYLVCEGKDLTAKQNTGLADQCTIFSKMFKGGDFSAFAGDAFRRATAAELSIVPGLLIDPDAQAWLKPILDEQHTRVMTRFILERAIFRSFRIVRAAVSGDQLVTIIDKALKARSYAGSCVIGTAESCSKTIDTKKPDTVKVNGRMIDSRSHYSIAMPEGLAEELKLPYAKGNSHTTDAVSALHQRLNGDGRKGWYVDGPEDTLGKRLQRRGEHTIHNEFLASSFEFGYTTLGIDPEPGSDGTREAQLQALDLEFRGITPARRLIRKFDFDLSLADTKWTAFRGLWVTDFSRRLDRKAAGNELVFEKNTMTMGARFDLKLPFFGRQIRPYVGYFLEGERQGPPQYLTAQSTTTRTDGSKMIIRAGGPTTFSRHPLRFHYKAVGIDILNNWKIFSGTRLPIDITRGTLQFGVGELKNVPYSATIDDVEQSRDTFKSGGAAGVLNAYFEPRKEGFNTDVKFVALEETRKQQRWQAELNLEPKATIKTKTLKFGTELRLRYYANIPDSSPGSLRYAARAKFTITLPVATRFEIVPGIEYHLADIKARNSGTFRHWKYETMLKVPLVIKRNGGWLVR